MELERKLVWRCPECGTEFISVGETACPACGAVRPEGVRVYEDRRPRGPITEASWEKFLKSPAVARHAAIGAVWRNPWYGRRTLELLNGYRECICFDTETTGLTHEAQIIQFSAIRLRLPEMTEIDRMDVYIRPDAPLPPKITEITGITNDMLEDDLPEKEMFPRIRDYLGVRPPLLCGYNVRFDLERLTDLYARNHAAFPSVEYLDIMEMAKDLVNPEKVMEKGRPRYKQSNVAKAVHADKGIKFHSAIDDTTVVVRLLRIFADQYREREAKPAGAKTKARLIRAFYWTNPKQKSMQRIWVYTDIGRVYIDTVGKYWREPKDKDSAGFFDAVDMEDLEAQVFRRWHVDNLDELILVTKNAAKLRGV